MTGNSERIPMDEIEDRKGVVKFHDWLYCGTAFVNSRVVNSQTALLQVGSVVAARVC